MGPAIIHHRIGSSAQGESSLEIIFAKIDRGRWVIAHDRRETPELSAIAELKRVPHGGNDECIDSARGVERSVKHSLGDRVVDYS